MNPRKLGTKANRAARVAAGIALAFFAVAANSSAQTPPPAKTPSSQSTTTKKSTTTATAHPAYDRALLHPALLKEKAPDEYKVQFSTTRGDFVVTDLQLFDQHGGLNGIEPAGYADKLSA